MAVWLLKKPGHTGPSKSGLEESWSLLAVLLSISFIQFLNVAVTDDTPENQKLLECFYKRPSQNH